MDFGLTIIVTVSDVSDVSTARWILVILVLIALYPYLTDIFVSHNEYNVYLDKYRQKDKERVASQLGESRQKTKLKQEEGKDKTF